MFHDISLIKPCFFLFFSRNIFTQLSISSVFVIALVALELCPDKQVVTSYLQLDDPLVDENPEDLNPNCYKQFIVSSQD